jgi:hypothetical protein
VRNRSPLAWLWVLLPLTAGVLIKEDVLVVAPALAGWQWLRARMARDVPGPTWMTMVIPLVWMSAYLAWRWFVLDQIGGYAWPTAPRAALNLISVPLFTFALQWIPDAHGISLIAGSGVAVLGLSVYRVRHHASSRLVALGSGGVCLGVFATAPLVLAAGHTRVHVLILAACLTFTAAIGVLIDAQRARPLPRWAAAWLVAATLAIADANWRNTNTFAPCSSMSITTRAEVLTWEFLSTDVLAAVARDAAACAASHHAVAR